MKIVIFDVDGTLVDTNYAHVESWHRALKTFGVFIPRARIHQYMGLDSKEMFSKILTSRQIEEFGNNCAKLKTKIYRHEMLPETEAFPKVRDLFLILKNACISIALATSAAKKQINDYLKKLDITGLPDVVITAEEIHRGKPDPEIFVKAWKKLRSGRSSPSEVAVIGDSIWDIEAAVVVGFYAVGVLSGGYSECSLQKAGANEIYLDVTDLYNKLDNSRIMQ